LITVFTHTIYSHYIYYIQWRKGNFPCAKYT